MKLVKLNSAQVESLYTERLVIDFPKDEQKPLNFILKAMDNGIYECFGLWDDNNIIGYVFLEKMEKDYLIDYLSVYPDKRNSGNGGECLLLLAELLADADNVLIEIEDPDRTDNIEEKELRTRRKNFYLRNNCKDTGLRVECFGVPFQILVLGKDKKTDMEYLKKKYVSFYQMIFPRDVVEKNIGNFGIE